MKWFRSHIKHGSRLALLALALQFAVSFGHFHETAQAATAIQSASAQLGASVTVVASEAAGNTAQQPASHPEPDQHPSDACAICTVIALASTALFATSPILQLPRAADLSYLTTDAGFVDLNSGRPAFQPRAPPAS
jgi:hypothetical protein